jgi:integrase
MRDDLEVYEGKTKTTYYTRINVDGKRKRINLGHDLAEALHRLDEVEHHGNVVPKTLEQIWQHYSTFDKGLLAKAPRTQKSYLICWNTIRRILEHTDMESIKPVHIKQYVGARSAPGAANREKALISILFNHARNYCGYEGSNPCLGIKGNPERGRSKNVEKWEYEEIYECADQTLKDVMDLLLFTGQRVSDVLNFKLSDIKKNVDLSRIRMYDGRLTSDAVGKQFADCLYIKPSKTEKYNKTIDIVIEGELKNIIDRIKNQHNDNKINSIYLLSDASGQKLSYWTINNKFKTARTLAGYKSFDIQLRDLRHKNASSSTLEEASQRLGHSSMAMTEKYRNNVMTVTVRPIKKLI